MAGKHVNHDKATRDKLIFRHQVEQLYALAPRGFLSTIVNSAIVFMVMREVTPPAIIVSWLVGVLGITVLRVERALKETQEKLTAARARSGPRTVDRPTG